MGMNARRSTVPVAPNKGERLSYDQLVRGSTMMRNSVTKRPVAFVLSMDEETVEASTTSKCSRASRKTRKVLSVDENFAKGIRDWRNEHDQFTSKKRTDARQFSGWGSGINRGSGVTRKDSHGVRKE